MLDPLIDASGEALGDGVEEFFVLLLLELQDFGRFRIALLIGLRLELGNLLQFLGVLFRIVDLVDFSQGPRGAQFFSDDLIVDGSRGLELGNLSRGSSAAVERVLPLDGQPSASRAG